jgi:short-subunit dehydrogenase
MKADAFRDQVVIVMDVNFYGAVYCTFYALPYLIRSHGRMVAVSSLGGKAPLPYNSPYIASKFAMHGFFDSLRIELKRHGVSVTIICPYWVVTGFHEAQMDKDGVPRGPGGRVIPEGHKRMNSNGPPKGGRFIFAFLPTENTSLSTAFGV